MKKIIFLLAFCLSFVFVNAQSENIDYSRSGNTFTSNKKETVKTPDEKTIYIWKDKDIEYPIYISKNGSCYIIRTSSKTGKEYKQYLDVEISKEICKELGREYKGKQRK